MRACILVPIYENCTEFKFSCQQGVHHIPHYFYYYYLSSFAMLCSQLPQEHTGNQTHARSSCVPVQLHAHWDASHSYLYLGCYDGHGGTAAVQWLKEQLHQLVAAKMEVSDPSVSQDMHFRTRKGAALADGGSWLLMELLMSNQGTVSTTKCLIALFACLLCGCVPARKCIQQYTL